MNYLFIRKIVSFQFGDICYKQRDIFMSRWDNFWHIFWLKFIYQILKKYFHQYSFKVKHSLSMIHVDNLLITIPWNMSEIERLNYLNSVNLVFKSTMESKIQNKLNFLDDLIQNENNKIIISFYRKPSNNLNFTTWNSFGLKTRN